MAEPSERDREPTDEQCLMMAEMLDGIFNEGQRRIEIARKLKLIATAARDEGRREERERCAWQPIETAPKDGNPIVVVQRDIFSGWHYWVEHRGASERWVNPDGAEDKPDCWMPLEPPNA